MEIRPYFDKIEDVIIEDVRASRKQLLIAVAWFTNHKIFDAIIEKLSEKHDFTAKLIIINDNINHRPGGLDFQKFVSVGGNLYFAEANIPMHNKYMVIDSDIVITGSYNYTYYAEKLNDENIVRINGHTDIVRLYIDNFNCLVSKKPVVKNLKEYLSVFAPATDIFSYSNYALKDMMLQTEINKEKGNGVEGIRQIEHFELTEKQETFENFIINNVIYNQWKDYYYIDKIEVRGSRIKVLYRTTLSDGCWLFSPKTLNAWVIRSTIDKNVFAESYAVRDVFVNGKMVISEAKQGTLYYFNEEGKPTSFFIYSCGYKKDNASGRPIDDKGDLVPMQIIQFPKKSILTCEVCFMADNPLLINEKIDFVEGLFCDKKKDHWNAFNIQMNVNRERLV